MAKKLKTRNKEEILEDFEYISEARARGIGFPEITLMLNDERPYLTSVDSNYQLYYKQIKHFVQSEKFEEQRELAVFRTLDEINWTINQALLAWSKSIGLKEQITIAGWENAKKKYETISMMQSEGNPKYLEIILKSLDRRAKLLGLNAPEKQEVKISDLLGKARINDYSEYENVEPVTSETQMLNARI